MRRRCPLAVLGLLLAGCTTAGDGDAIWIVDDDGTDLPLTGASRDEWGVFTNESDRAVAAAGRLFVAESTPDDGTDARGSSGLARAVAGGRLAVPATLRPDEIGDRAHRRGPG